jgi:hypothetical protein
MVEVTQADRAEAIRYWGNDNPPVELQAAFTRHRIAVRFAAFFLGYNEEDFSEEAFSKALHHFPAEYCGVE